MRSFVFATCDCCRQKKKKKSEFEPALYSFCIRCHVLHIIKYICFGRCAIHIWWIFGCQTTGQFILLWYLLVLACNLCTYIVSNSVLIMLDCKINGCMINMQLFHNYIFLECLQSEILPFYVTCNSV